MGSDSKVRFLASVIRWESSRQNNKYNMTFYKGRIRKCMHCFLGPHPWHVEVPRLGSNWNCSCQLIPQPLQCRIQAAPVTPLNPQPDALKANSCPALCLSVLPASSLVLVIIDVFSSPVNETFRRVSPSTQVSKGMWNTPQTKLRTSWSCHCGSAERNLTHEDPCQWVKDLTLP